MNEIKFAGFTGINNQAGADSLANTDFSVALNVDINDVHDVLRRGGFTQRASASAHSLFAVGDALYYRTAGELHRVDPISWTDQLVDTGLTGTTCYGAVGDRVFYSDGYVARTLRDGEGAGKWGVAPPLLAPLMASWSGSLPAGSYLCSMTYRRADGEESGAPTPGRINVDGGITFSAPASPDPAVTEKIIYLSRAGGETLYRAVIVPNAQSDVSYGGSGSDFGPALDSLHKTPPPASSLIGSWNGRVAVGAGSFLLYSDLFRFERFDPIRQSIPFDSAPTMLAALTPEVCFVGTKGAIWRLDGTDFSDVRAVQVASYGAIAGSACFSDTFAADGSVVRSAYFATPKGLCMARGAELTNLTGTRYLAAGVQGSSLYRGADGNHQVLFSLGDTP